MKINYLNSTVEVVTLWVLLAICLVGCTNTIRENDVVTNKSIQSVETGMARYSILTKLNGVTYEYDLPFVFAEVGDIIHFTNGCMYAAKPTFPSDLRHGVSD